MSIASVNDVHHDRINGNRKLAAITEPLGLGIGSSRRLTPRELVFGEGDPRTHLYSVVEGVLCSYKLLSDGRRQIDAFYFAGEVVGIGVGGTHAVNAEAISPAVVRSVPIGTVDRMVHSRPEFGWALLEIASQQLAEASEHLLNLGKRSVNERVSAFLISLAERCEHAGQDNAAIVVPMTRTDMADFLGMRLETVSRCVNRFKWLGLIETPQPNLIILKDRPALEAMAGGESRPS
ncbi:MAG TPA: helix-turn-helix domain-containing protein [Hyphomicrobiales bacterium]|nr:helix-turn-helix domain-containing protein [Rhodobiaceae bacterium]HXK53120.1 helix-turn-helix domain-containing protein [Hyphomicrobiales bacterium]